MPKSARFNVVHFMDTEEVEVAPDNWYKNNVCYWPPYKVPNRLSKAVKYREIPNRELWTSYKARILHTYDSYEEARKKLYRSEFTSDPSSTDAELGEQKRAVSSDDGSEEDQEQIKNLSVPNLPQFEEVETSGQQYTEIGNSIRKCINISKSHHSDDDQDNVNSDFYHPAPISSPGINKRLNQGSSEVPATNNSIPEFVEEFREFRTQVYRMLNDMKATQIQHGEMLDMLINQSNQSKQLETSEQSLECIYSLLPLKTIDDLTEMELKLKDKEFKESVVTALAMFGGSCTNNAIRILLKKTLANELACQFSWQGAKGIKPFRNYGIAEVIMWAIRRNPLTKDTTNKQFEDSVKVWLRHAKERIKPSGNMQAPVQL